MKTTSIKYLCAGLVIGLSGYIMLAQAAAGTNPKPTSIKSTNTSVQTEVEFYSSAQHKAMNLPFSESVRVGNTLYLSGQIGIKPGAKALVPGGIKAETRQTMINIRRTLQHQGATLNNIVKCTVFLANMSEWQAMNEVYVEFFGDHKPARSAFGVNGVALNGHLEMECMAVINAK